MFSTQLDRSCPAVRNGWACAICTFEITTNRYRLVANCNGFAVPVHAHCFSAGRDQLAGVISPVLPSLHLVPLAADSEHEIQAAVASFMEHGMIRCGPAYPLIVSA